MREKSIPPLYEVPADDSLLGPVIRNTAEQPERVLLARQVDGGWLDVTAARFLAEVRSAAKGLIASGVKPRDKVAIMSRTRYEWTVLDYAVWGAGAVSVPIYETSSAEQVEWILKDSGAVAVVVETEAHLALVARVRPGLPALTQVWTIDDGALEQLDAGGASVSDEQLDERIKTLGPDELATIIYTSGTTGRPKGCVITHRNLLAECGNTIARLRPLFHDDASSLLFLPLAHVLGRVIQLCSLAAPVKLGHVSDLKELPAALATFQPTFLPAVPRVFEKVYNSARAQAVAGGKQKVFDLAVDTSIAYSRALETPSGPGLALKLKHKLFDRLVYGKLRAVLGGRAAYALSGGAPLGERLGHFYRGLGFVVLEGYGLAESSAATTTNPPDVQKIGTVGLPLPGSSVRIAEDGEIQLKGEHIFTGYWNNPEATAAVLDADGWFSTGDLGALDEEGYLRITGRKKEIIVTAGGKNVAPAVIEDRIRSHALVAECMVVGDAQPFIAALITLDEEMLPRWAAQNGKEALTPQQLRVDPELVAEVQLAVDLGNAAVSRAEAVREFRILDIQFTEASGHLTPSLKLKRNVVRRDFDAQIREIYAE
ncbi:MULTISPECIES: long-chain fatty acid--CoA ligase [Actinosynnema]|uniref:AMP-dependent synthetase/ligase n=1 Tax=Actinosynnema TaxID=40566 RepID=UPI0020A2A1BB|nr:AMP-dependent synthetase/ligase [Actinosynnema pretiosum]MCP2094383.1 long-chain acyl-CoA synthetase [Actinosynnema pretiosum]